MDLHCAMCGKEVETTGYRCGACTRVVYCGAECQAGNYPEHKASCVRDTAARVDVGEGELIGAECTMKRALEEARVEFGGEHEKTLFFMCKYVKLLMNMGRFQEAQPLCSELVSLRRRVLGDAHPTTLASISNLASLL